MRKYALIIGILLLMTIFVAGCTDSLTTETSTPCCGCGDCINTKTAVIYKVHAGDSNHQNHLIDSDQVVYGYDGLVWKYDEYSGHNVTFVYQCKGGYYEIISATYANPLYDCVNKCSCTANCCTANCKCPC